MFIQYPTVSIIVPVYNGGQTLSSCLESLLNQNYPCDAYEIIVVENGSTDETLSIAQRYPVRLLQSHQRGPAAARNLGIRHSHSEIIAFTDADCIAHPDWLAELVKPYEDFTVGGVAGEILAYQDDERNIVERFSDEFSPLKNFISGAGEFLPHLYTANASYRREVLQKVGGFNPDLFTAEDVDLSWRVQLESNYRVRYAQQAIIYHQHRSTWRGLSRQYRQYGFGEIMLDRMYGSYADYPRTNTFQLERIIRQIFALPRYLVSMGISFYRLRCGYITSYQAAIPRLLFLIEGSNIIGKLDAIWEFRNMFRPVEGGQKRLVRYIQRYY